MLDESIEQLRIRPDGIYADGTLGGGGHSFEICSRLSAKGRLFGFDADEDAIAAASKRLEKFSDRTTIIRSNFCNMAEELAQRGIAGVDGIILDLGVSSYQLDDPARGFTYRADAPLDMRMDRRQALTADEIVNKWNEKKLAEIFVRYGEEKPGRAKMLAREIVHHRPVKGTKELAEIIASKSRYSKTHPATQIFQAIRIVVNDELEEIEKTLMLLPKILNPGGRVALITFHSLEDRLVKEYFREVSEYGEESELKILNKKPIVAGKSELVINPRSRSAKLRAAERI